MFKLSKCNFLSAQAKSEEIYIHIYIIYIIYIYLYIYIYIYEKSVGTTELHYSTKKREHCFSILC